MDPDGGRHFNCSRRRVHGGETGSYDHGILTKS